MKQLKLMAMDKEDLEVISSCCQDAVLKIGEMNYFPGEKRFTLTLNRFAWEVAGQRERRRSVLHFERVNGVRLSGIDRSELDLVTSLLAILFEENAAPQGVIELVFAGDGAIRLDVECVEAQLTDMPASWEAQSVPTHKVD